MGMTGHPRPMKSGNIFVWQGERNLKNCYDVDFEKPFLTATQEYFESFSNVKKKDLNCPEYLEEAKRSLQREEEDADFWLEPDTKPKMLEIVHEELITKQAEDVVSKPETGCENMFEKTLWQELKLMYEILHRGTDTLKLIIQRMNPYIEKRGNAIVTDKNLLKDPNAFSKALLALKAEMDEVIAKSFDNHMQFQKGRDVSF